LAVLPRVQTVIMTDKLGSRVPGMQEDDVVLMIEEIDSEGGVINRRRLEEDEESPLLRTDESTHDDWEGPKSPGLTDLPWYKKPSV
jgi:hypothetical protein